MEMITKHTGMTYSGMGTDFRVLVRKARKIAQQYYLQYDEEIPISQLVQRIANVMQEYTHTGLASLSLSLSLSLYPSLSYFKLEFFLLKIAICSIQGS